ncbi:MAG TPA: hypothetical protein VFC18_04380 [Burkholderiales bacterium]|nr:hypothetical protein [Burkholderiales bacterium]
MNVFLGIALIAALFGFALYAAFVSFHRVLRHDGRLRLLEAARMRGVELPDPQNDAAAYGAGLASFRCVTCGQIERCDKVLPAGDWRALREICPNADYLEGLKREQHAVC